MSAGLPIQYDELEVRYCKILTQMKDDILLINDAKLLRQYTIWLERLSDPNYPNKVQRNRYLTELARQIQSQTLGPPFTNMKDMPRTVKESPRSVNPRYRPPSRKESVEVWPNFKRAESAPKRTPKTSSRQSDNSSWIDLSDDSSLEQLLACGDADGEEGEKGKNFGQSHAIEARKLQELYKKKYEEELTMKRELKGADFQENSMQREVEGLKMRMRDLLEVKNALKDTQHLTEDWKKTIDALKTKLEEMQRRNMYLRKIVTRQSKNLADLNSTKERDMLNYKETFEDYRQKELQILNHRHLEEKQNFEILYQNRIIELQNEFQMQLEALKANYETKITEVVRTNSLLLQEKESELLKVQQEHKSTKTEEATAQSNANGEVIQLKRVISKLDKLLTKNERDYVKKIEKLKSELQLRDVATQIQLQTQRADLIVRHASTKKEELEEAINILESKYKEIVTMFQGANEEKYKQTDLIIQDLKKVLDDSNSYPDSVTSIAC